jgi:hypothetical protein
MLNVDCTTLHPTKAGEPLPKLVLARRTESNSHPEIRSSGPNADPIRTSDPNSNIDSVVALASEAIRYVDQKKRN